MTTNPLLSLSNGLADAAESACASVLMVNARRRLPASGILYAENLVLTADHIIEKDSEIVLLTPGGDEVEGALVGRDPGSDLAVIRGPVEDASSLTASDENVRVGQIVLALGRPSNRGIQASLGVVSAIGGAVRVIDHGGSPRQRRGRHQRGSRGFSQRSTMRQVLENYIRTDAIPYPGFSGGPLVDASGNIIGINTSGLARGISLAIPLARALLIAEALEKHGSVRRGYLGIRSQGVELSAAQQETLGREQASGLLLIWIEQGSAADKGGLIVGDILVGFSDQPVEDHEDLQTLLGVQEALGKAAVEILRAGMPETRTIEIGERED